MNINQLHEFEGLHIHHDKKTQLFAIVAIHSTLLGPTIGGCRCVHYDTVDAAIADAMLLARAMSRKSAISELPNGGAKAVIIKPPVIKDRRAFFESYGEFVDSLQGVYYTAVDSGTYPEDIDVVASKTDYISAQVANNANREGDASFVTAYSVYHCMKAAAKHALGTDNLSGVTVGIQGTGKVGSYLIDLLTEEQANIIASEVNHKQSSQVRDKHPNIHIVSPTEIMGVECDILAPCALGGTVNNTSVHDIQAKVVCGAANNQLQHLDAGQQLLQRGICFVPDFVANAGGVILASLKLNGMSESDWLSKAKNMSTVTQTILARSEQEKIATQEIACHIADERLNKA